MRRLALTALLVAGAWLAGCETESTPPAPVRGQPDLRIGMTLEAARAALSGSGFKSYSGPGGVCTQFTVTGGLGGLAERGRIQVISFRPELDTRGEVIGRGPATARGLRPGDGVRRAIKLYGRPRAIAPSEYGGEDVYWRLPDEGGRHIWLRLATGQQRGGGLQIGRAPMIYYPEGCA